MFTIIVFILTSMSLLISLRSDSLPMQNNRWIRIQFRLLASVPPIVFGILERNLGTITDYAGTTGFVVGFSFPAVLYLQSKAVARKKQYQLDTYYSSYASFNFVAWALFFFGIGMVLFVLLCLARGEDEVD